MDTKEDASKVPGTQLIWIKTYGCSHNVSDSEYMQGVLTSYGYRFTQDPDVAQLWLLAASSKRLWSWLTVCHKLTDTSRAWRMSALSASSKWIVWWRS